MKLGEIVHDSIIENKEKTKSYWEQLMLAAGNSPSSSIEVKQSNNQSPSSQMVNQGVTQRLVGDGEPQDGPKIVETVTKRNSLDKTESNYKTNNGLSNGKRGSVIEREIQMQKEREAAFAQEREEALRKAGSSISSESRSLIDQEETLNFSIPTTDDGNFSEYGSEDKEEHSFDENRSMGMSPEMTVMRSGLHHRTQSLDSMSSGHSSGSIGSLGSGHPLPESCIRRRPVTVKPLDQPEEENLLAFVRSDKETPIEREIRLSKEREEELRREKQTTPSSDVSKTRSKSLTIDSPAIKCITIESGPKLSTLPLNRGCVKKVITKTRNLNSESESPKSPVNDNTQKTLTIGQINTTPDSSAKGAVPKLFSRNPNQKGLMKRFIASKGKLSSTFTFSSPVISPANSKNNSLVQLSPAKLQQWNSFINNNKNNNNNNNVNHHKDEKDTALVGSRPGYVSAEDKIQVELQEMRKREQELKEQRARSFIRSQPDLLSLLNEEDEDKPNGEPLKLRSALSNPNLIDIDENDKALSNEVKPSIKRSPLIDVWESMIQKK